MRKIIFILAAVYILFVLEYFTFNLFGDWFKPNFLVLLIVYINLFLGIRYSLLTAFLAGMLKDSYGLSAFGIHIFAFMLCAFLMTISRRYLFHTGRHSLSLILGFCMTAVYVVLMYLIHSIFVNIEFKEVLKFIMLPEVISTTLVAGFTFQLLRSCALKFSVSS